MRSLYLAAAAAALPALAGAQPGQVGPMYDGWMWWMPFHGVLSLLIIAAVVVGIIVLVRLLWPSNSNSAGNGSARRSGALDLLDERYARGELDRDEYLQRKRDLSAR